MSKGIDVLVFMKVVMTALPNAETQSLSKNV